MMPFCGSLDFAISRCHKCSKINFCHKCSIFLNLSHELQHFRFEVLLICVLRHTALHKFGLTDWLVGWLVDWLIDWLTQRSKVKVIRSTAETRSTSYLSNGAYELETWKHLSTKTLSSTSAMTTKVKGQGRDVTLGAWQVLVHKSRMKSPRNTTICYANFLTSSLLLF